MKNQIKKLLLIILVIFGITNIFAQGNFETDNAISIGESPTLYGDGNTALYWDSDNAANSQLILRNNQPTILGKLQGINNTNGKYIGIKDAANKWSYLALQGKWTVFKVNNKNIALMNQNGLLLYHKDGDNNQGGKLTLQGADVYSDWKVDNYAGTFRISDSNNTLFRINSNGNVGIGTEFPDDNKLEVNGTVRAKEIKVQSDWADYVFDDAYELPSLDAEQQNIENEGHLIGFASEADMNGEIQLGDIAKKQQIKIEEMMLHLIEMNKKVEQLEQDKASFGAELELLKQ